MRNLFFAVALADAAALVMASLAGGIIVAAIQMRHADTWNALGRPRVSFLHYPIRRSSMEVQRYIFSGAFRDLADDRLSLWCNVFRLSLGPALVGIVVLIALYFVGW